MFCHRKANGRRRRLWRRWIWRTRWEDENDSDGDGGGSSSDDTYNTAHPYDAIECVFDFSSFHSFLPSFIFYSSSSFSIAHHFSFSVFSDSLDIFPKKNRTIDNQPHHHTRFGRVSGILYVLLRIACTTATISKIIASDTNSFICCCLLCFITCIHIFVVLRLSLKTVA